MPDIPKKEETTSDNKQFDICKGYAFCYLVKEATKQVEDGALGKGGFNIPPNPFVVYESEDLTCGCLVLDAYNKIKKTSEGCYYLIEAENDKRLNRILRRLSI